MPLNNLITFRKGSETSWTTSNPVLASGEPGYDLTNNILKVGDGVTSWNSLNSIGGAGASSEAIDDRVASLLVAGSGINLNYNDTNNNLTISFTGIDLGTYPLITISSQPINTSGTIDSNLSFSVTASSSFPTKPINYQWQKSSNNTSFTNISNATNSTLSITGVQLTDNGYYRCYITSDLSYKYSDSATLTALELSSQSYIYEKLETYSWI